MRYNLLMMLNYLLSQIHLVIIIGLLVLLFSERKAVISLFQKTSKTTLQTKLSPIFHRLLYIVGGYLLIIFSFAIVSTILSTFFAPEVTPTFPEIIPTTLENLDPALSFLAPFKQQSSFGGFIFTLFLIMSGISLILSAGNKWLVTFAKLLLTTGFLYMFITAFAYYA